MIVLGGRNMKVKEMRKYRFVSPQERASEPKRRKTLDGHFYYLQGEYQTKSEAQHFAEHSRNWGGLARIIKVGKWYRVYSRAKNMG